MTTENSSGVLIGEEFLSLVSHEIKNPLTSITGFADFAEDAVRNNDHDGALEHLEIVRSEARRILRLAEDLLDASCLKAGKFRLMMGEVDVPSIVARVVARYAATSQFFQNYVVELAARFSSFSAVSSLSKIVA